MKNRDGHICVVSMSSEASPELCNQLGFRAMIFSEDAL